MNSSNNSRGPGGKFFLIGFMGSGKTHWGKIWAKKNALDFFDLDQFIEEREHKSIATIFEINGETYFREKEATALRTLEGKDNCIVACGGGTPCFNDNMNWMNEHGKTIYLESTARDIFDRVLKEQDQRPLIKSLGSNELLSFIEQKLKERDPFYRQASIILPAEELDAGSIEKIINY